MSFWRSLSIRNFALLWSGQTISRMGDQLHRIALAWWVLQKTGSATAMGTVLIFTSVPMVVFLLVGGVAVDRFHRPRVMLLSDLIRGSVVALIAVLMWQDVLTLEMIYGLAIVFGVVDAFFQPAYIATVPQVVPPEFRPSANSLTALSGEFAGVIGPAIGAGIVSLGGTAFAFGLNALSFFAGAALLIPLLTLKSEQVPPEQRTSPLHDLREGFRTVFESPFLWVTIALASLANFTIGGPYAVAMPFLVNENLGAGVGGLGLLYSMTSAGSVVVAVVMGRLKRLRRRGIALYASWVVASLAIAAFGLPVSIWVIAGGAFVFGGLFTVVNLIWANALQEMVQPEKLGRVSSIDYLGSFGLNPFGYAFTGWATDRVGAPLVFLVGGIASAVIGSLGLLSKRIRELD